MNTTLYLLGALVISLLLFFFLAKRVGERSCRERYLDEEQLMHARVLSSEYCAFAGGVCGIIIVVCLFALMLRIIIPHE